MFSQAAFLDEATRRIGFHSSFVASFNPEIDAADVVFLESEFEEEVDSFSAVPTSPIVFVADANAEFGRLGDVVLIEQGALTDKFVVGFNREFDAITAAFAGIFIKFNLQAGQGLGHGWVATPGQLYIQVIVKGSQPRQVFSLDSSQG
jgi:hypothetical protein